MRTGLPQTTAKEQAQKATTSGVPFAELPTPAQAAPFRAQSANLGVAPVAQGHQRTLHVIGDTGGVSDPNPQMAVAAAMVADVEGASVDFAFHVGDIGYYEGEQQAYEHQFFEPYASYPRPIVGIPGNHDGAGNDQLHWWMTYFAAASATLPPEVEEFHRDTQVQPYCYWTLDDDALTIIGLYSNVPSGGVIEPAQASWLVGELEAAPHDRPLLVALHHPPYSVDGHHGGSARMGEVLDGAFKQADRWPHMVLSGHVHDAQFFTRRPEGAPHEVSYVVIGNGGYHNLHSFAQGARAGEEVAPGVTFDYGDDQGFGFLRLEVLSADVLSGEYVGVARDGTVTPRKYTFQVDAAH